MRKDVVVGIMLWGVTGLCFSILFVTSLGESPEILQAFPGADLVLHLVGYLVTTFFLLLAAVWHPWAGHNLKRRTFVAALLVGMVALGVGLELGQFAAERRTPDVYDGIVNALGVLLAGGTWGLLRTAVTDGIRSGV